MISCCFLIGACGQVTARLSVFSVKRVKLDLNKNQLTLFNEFMDVAGTKEDILWP